MGREVDEEKRVERRENVWLHRADTHNSTAPEGMSRQVDPSIIHLASKRFYPGSLARIVQTLKHDPWHFLLGGLGINQAAEGVKDLVHFSNAHIQLQGPEIFEGMMAAIDPSAISVALDLSRLLRWYSGILTFGE